MVKKQASSNELIDLSDELKMDMDYGYGSGADIDAHNQRVDATIQFFAQPQERHELKRTARRASLGGVGNGEFNGSCRSFRYEEPQLFVRDEQFLESVPKKNKHRRASMGATPTENFYSGGIDLNDIQNRRRGSVGRSNAGEKDLRLRQSQSQRGALNKMSMSSRSFDYHHDEIFYQTFPLRHGRRASTGGNMVISDDYVYKVQPLQQDIVWMQQQQEQQHTAMPHPTRSRARRQSLNSFDVAAEDNIDQSMLPNKNPGRRMSNGYSNRQPRRLSNGYSQAHIPLAEPQTLKFGINPDVVARMSRRMSGNAAQAVSQGLHDDDDDEDYDEDEPDSGYADHDLAAMGYGYAAPTISRHQAEARLERRGSNRSYGSARIGAAEPYERRYSHRSHISANGGIVDPFGYGYGAPTSRTAELPKYERRGSNRSQSSSRSRRRNSCLIRPDQNPFMLQEIAVGPPRVADSDLELEVDHAAGPGQGQGIASDVEVSQEDHSDIYGYGIGKEMKHSDAAKVLSSSSEDGHRTAKVRTFSSDDDNVDSQGELASGASDSEQSMSSTKRLRRNSCLMGPDGSMSGGEHQSYASGYHAQSAGTSNRGLSSDDDNLHLLQAMDDEEDYNDPDSLLNRSGYLNSVIQGRTKPKPVGKLGMHLARGKANYVLEKDEDTSSDEESMLDVLNKANEKKRQEAEKKEKGTVVCAGSPVGPVDTTVVDADKPRDANLNQEHTTAKPSPQEDALILPPPHLACLRSSAAARARPFTTPHATLSAENLLEVQKGLVKHEPIPGKSDHSNPIIPISTRNAYNWGDIDFDSEVDESDDSEMSFGASMYNDIHVFQELDRYKQMPRRRLSLDKTIIDMSALLEEQSKKAKGLGRRVPAFKPAAGCTNAADYILRPFCARMRTGLTVIKHNKSRWSKSAKRVIYLTEDARTLTWKLCDDDPLAESSKGKRPKLDLLKCREVRHAWEPDPESRKKTGTATTRAKCTKEGVANKTFSLIFSKRTLDVTAASSDQCKMLMEGFSALCFRLQLERIQKQTKQSGVATDEDSDIGLCASGSFTTENDWASTIYGDETVSMTQSATSKTHLAPGLSPWGL